MRVLLSLFLCLFHAEAQFYGQITPYHQLDLQKLFSNRHNLNNFTRGVQGHPLLRDPLGTLLARNASSGLNAAEFLCDMFRHWTAPAISDKCGSGLRNLVCGLAGQLASSDPQWPIKVIDSMGKIPSGILEGDITYWPGAYDQCKGLNVEIDNGEPSITNRHWKGEFCAAHVGFPSLGSGQRCNPDPKKTTFVTVGICVPEGCTTDDLNHVFYEVLPVFNFVTCWSAVLGCEPEKEATWVTWVMLALIVVVAIFLIFGTVFDVFSYQGALEKFAKRKRNQETITENSLGKNDPIVVTTETKREFFADLSWFWKALLCFSVYSNGQKLMGGAEGQLACVHGIRFLSMAWVILGHTYFFSMGYLSNPAIIVKMPDQFFFQLVNNATPSVDSFFLLSGFLLSYLFLKRAQTATGKKQLKTLKFWLMYYVHRYLRLTPLYAIVMGLGYGLWDFLGRGPLWANHDTNGIFNQCPTVWWRNLLYIQNMWDYSEQCIGWVWYLANDMQFYWIAPPFIILLYIKPLFGVLASLFMVIASAVLRAVMIIVDHHPPMAMLTDDPTGKWADPTYQTKIYSKPWMRAGPYFVGLILGWLLLKTQGKLRMRKFFAFPIWVAIFAVTSAVIFGLYDFARGHDPGDFWRAFYGGFARTGWAVAVAATIYLCHQGYGGFINTVLSCPVFFPLSRLTYCAYLIHEIVIAYYYSTLDAPFYGTHYKLVNYFFANLVLSYAIALVLSLGFEAPVMQLEKLIFEPTPRKKPTYVRQEEQVLRIPDHKSD